jgi:SAM-dependent methyltransferase
MLIKLNLGCGGSTPSGWVNVDFGPGAKLSKVPILRHASRYIFRHDWDSSIFMHDLRKPLPWKDNSVSYIYSSHTLEHLTKIDGERLAFETFRVLEPGGIVRIVVPDLGHAVERYRIGAVDATDFLSLLSAVDTKPHSLPRRVFSLMAGSGHRCMYDVTALSNLLEYAGFRVRSMFPFDSEIPDISSIERSERTTNAAIVEGSKRIE